MNYQLALVLLLLLVAVVMFAINRPRLDAVGLLVLVAMPFTGVITMDEALAGFSDPAVVLIAALFVMGEGLVRTGVARHVGDWLDAKAGASESRLLAFLMAAVAGLGSFMSSTAVVAIFIPVVLRISQNRGVPPGRLMMPLSIAALISGMMTLIATAPNLIVNAELSRHGIDPFNFFSFTPFGLPVLVLGIVYMLVARKLLVRGATHAGKSSHQFTLAGWIERYDLTARERRFLVTESSTMVGKRLDELRLRHAGINLLAIERGSGLSTEVLRPMAHMRVEAGDMLLADVNGSESAFKALCQTYSLELHPLQKGNDYFNDRSQEIGMVEVILPAESSLLGQTVLEAQLRSEYGLTAIGLRHGTKVVTDRLLIEKLKQGDTLLLVGFWSDIGDLRNNTADMVVLNIPSEFEEVLPAPRRAPRALAVLGLTVLLMVSGVIPNVQAALIGCLLMGLFGCINFNSAYASISWKTLVLIVGMLPFSLALQRTGGVDLVAHAVVDVVGAGSPRSILAALFAITALLGLFISNTATAVLMAPIAVAIAADIGSSPRPFAMIVALAASTAFMTPVSSPVNMLVVGPGGYTFGDFVKVGTPFSVVVAIVSVVLVPILIPL